MRVVVAAALGMTFMQGLGFGQATFEVTGTPVPPDLLKVDYGALPKSLGAFDVSICNLTELKQTVLSSRVYHSLAESNPNLQPMGRQTVLAVILRNQGRRPYNILSMTLSSVTGIFSVIGASKLAIPSNLSTAIAFTALTGQQLLTTLKPSTAVNQIEKFESEALEPSFILDGGACVQRTLFTVKTDRAKATPLSFHVR